MIGYVDTSAVVALAFDEHHAARVARSVSGMSHLVSSDLLEAEMRSACRRRGFPMPTTVLSAIHWVHPHRRLSREMAIAENAGPLRGADLWHVANALYLEPEPAELAFVTLDRRQEKVAAGLGFRVLPSRWLASGTSSTP